ncbi:hypothetical protein [Henriciella sp.]|uniref:hypothetical protein n=1 Tax=Henriciella sp. TaxID=1968823 RepID=UPI0026231A28|nr:hypothetical protein [Henriciella sp.]
MRQDIGTGQQVSIRFTHPVPACSNLGHGYCAEVRIVVWETPDALTVPTVWPAPINIIEKAPVLKLMDENGHRLSHPRPHRLFSLPGRENPNLRSR